LVAKDGLFLTGSPFRHIPEGLRVEGSLNLASTQVTYLPDGFRVAYDLILDFTGFTHLPTGLWVGGSLHLADVPIRHLPEGLHVGGTLDLSTCPHWDGQIPADTFLGGRLITLSQPPLCLEEWRCLHPGGELPAGRKSLRMDLHSDPQDGFDGFDRNA
jgi:hypothetical protein